MYLSDHVITLLKHFLIRLLTLFPITIRYSYSRGCKETVPPRQSIQVFHFNQYLMTLQFFSHHGELTCRIQPFPKHDSPFLVMTVFGAKHESCLLHTHSHKILESFLAQQNNDE